MSNTPGGINRGYTSGCRSQGWARRDNLNVTARSRNGFQSCETVVVVAFAAAEEFEDSVDDVVDNCHSPGRSDTNGIVVSESRRMWQVYMFRTLSDKVRSFYRGSPSQLAQITFECECPMIYGSMIVRGSN